MQKLQECTAQLTKELKDTTVRLSGELQITQQKLDRFHPELQSLQVEFQNADMRNSLLQIELSKKNEEIQDLEGRLHAFTSLAMASSSVEELAA